MDFKGKSQLDQAETSFQKAVTADPNNVKAHYDLAWTLALEGKKPEAITEFKAVLGLTPDPTQKKEATAALKRLGAG
jgi:tetratricopeptide (TPR) repeat protein